MLQFWNRGIYCLQSKSKAREKLFSLVPDWVAPILMQSSFSKLESVRISIFPSQSPALRLDALCVFFRATPSN